MSIIESHPRYVEHREQVDRLNEKERAWHANVQRLSAEWGEQHRDWQHRRDQAVEEGRPFSEPPPEHPHVDVSVGQRFIADRQQLRDEERAVLREIADEILNGARQQEAEILREARPLIRQLDEVMSRLRSLQADANKVRSAAGQHGTPPAMDVATVVDAVRSGRSLLTAEEQPKTSGILLAPDTEPEVRSQRPQRTTGLRPAGAFGQPPPMPSRSGRPRIF